MQEFVQMLQYLLATISTDIIAEDFSYGLLKVLQKKFLDIFTGNVQMVNKPTHISGSLIDHVHIKKALMEEFFINVNVGSIYFSDHNAVNIAIQKNYVDFHVNP